MGLKDLLFPKKKPKTATEIARENYEAEQREHEKTIGREAYWAGRIGGAKARQQKEGWKAGYTGKTKSRGAMGVLEDFGTALNQFEQSPIGQSMTLDLGWGGSAGGGRGNRGPSRRSRQRRKKHHKRSSPKNKKSSGSQGLGFQDFM